jgi:hypothetical protein
MPSLGHCWSWPAGKAHAAERKAGADSRPAPDNAVRSDSVTAANVAPAARLTATSAARPTAIQVLATAQPRSCARYSKAAMPQPHSSTAGSVSLPSREPVTSSHPGFCA